MKNKEIIKDIGLIIFIIIIYVILSASKYDLSWIVGLLCMDYGFIEYSKVNNKTRHENIRNFILVNMVLIATAFL
ncbi:hypothetical protein [Granulicatella balaenopterae]|uniref:hypothetical protein n=1 Tax=Granulicatella balaenopterae TaxID=137733 RepID=UPI000B8016F0|nr:hypothetical protein [Granulicatella balaenopterae]